MREARGNFLRLRQSIFIQWNIGASAKTLILVPLCFAVTDEEKAGTDRAPSDLRLEITDLSRAASRNKVSWDLLELYQSSLAKTLLPTPVPFARIAYPAMATAPEVVQKNLDQEREWIARVQGGDADAFRHLYDAYARFVFRYTMLRVRNAQDAEDITADTFVRAWRSIGKFEWREVPFGAWLLRIAQNLIIDRSRKPVELFGWLPWERGKQDNEFSQLEDRDEILGAFRKLSNEHQIILYLHFFEGYNLNHVAEFLGKSPNAVTVAQFRALERLRKVLKHVEFDAAG